ncbi:Pleiotropic drug resistance protein transporter, partial [Phytophthora megakarya]
MSTFTLSIFNLFGGFVMAKNVIPDWLIWVYWFVPDSYTLRGLCVNQYRAAKFDVCVYDDVDYCAEYDMKMGEYLLKQYAVPSGHYWVWIDVIYLCCIYVFFMGLGAFVLEYKRYDGPGNVSLKPKHDINADKPEVGKITGKILLNGYEANDLAIRRATGYCEQMDVHSDASTIRESLTFSAFLRQDSDIPESKKYDTVNECLDLLDMHEIADKIVRGCSQEQMKRLVELAAQPSILFLDEPTSGLDAHSAKLIMDGPSSDVFFLFDHLLLLKRGGESVFVGEL